VTGDCRLIFIAVGIGLGLDFQGSSLVECADVTAFLKPNTRDRGVRKSPWILITCVVVGGLFGSLLGEILLAAFKPGVIQNVFTQSVSVGIDPPFKVGLWMLTISAGFTLKMNLLTFIGILLGVFVYKQI